MSDTVGLASIGLGWWGGVLAKAATSSGRARLVSCFARSEDRRREFAAAHGCEAASSLDALLEGPSVEGVLIATPHTTHANLTLRAFAAGKHVFVDKPLTLTLSEADRVTSAADQADRVLQVGHNRRRQQANRRIREMLSDGGLGAVHHIEANHSAPLLFNPSLSAWRLDPRETPAGGMTALGVHQVDTFHYLLGPIARVTSVVSTRLLPEGEVDDTTAVTLEFESGAVGQLVTSQATGPVVDLAVHGTAASAWNLEDGAVFAVQERGSTDRRSERLDAFDTIADEVGEFARSIRGETAPETGAAEGRAVVAVLEAIVRSAEQGAPVDVER